MSRRTRRCGCSSNTSTEIPGRSNHARCLALIALLLPGIALAAEARAWLAEASVQRRLAAGEAIVVTAPSNESARSRAHILAAVSIAAGRERIWAIMTDCRAATLYVPGLRRCRVLATAADGRSADIEHEIRYSWFLPAVRYVFRADYEPPSRIRIRRIAGDVREEEATWTLTASANGRSTIVDYEAYFDPGFWIPQALVTRSLRRDLPAALAGLRELAERAGPAGNEARHATP
jgi:uncharacterized protein YndB with AHSA1/START domain